MIANAWERDNHIKASIEAEMKRTKAIQTAERAIRFASIGALTGGISHEINQPLNALKVAVDGMLYWNKRNRLLTKEELTKNLDFISDQVVRIDDIIKHESNRLRRKGPEIQISDLVLFEKLQFATPRRNCGIGSEVDIHSVSSL